MSIRLDSYTEVLSYNATPPPPIPNGFTITGWVNLASKTQFSVALFQVQSNHGGEIRGQIEIATNPEYHLGVYTGDNNPLIDIPFETGQWYWFAVRVGIGGVPNSAEVDLGLATELDSITHFTRATINSDGSPTELYVGGQAPFNEEEYWDGQLAYFRVWSNALSDTEVLAEVQSTTPVRTADLWADWPLLTASDLTDHSGNGHDLGGGGSGITTEGNPPISVRQYTPVVTSSVGVQDVASDVDARALHGLVIDQLGITDGVDVTHVRHTVHVVTDSVAITGDVETDHIRVMESVVTDDVDLADVASDVEARAFHGLVLDQLAVTDDVEITQQNADVVADDLTITDAVSITRSATSVVDDNAGISDVTQTQATVPRTVTDAEAITDVVVVDLARVRSTTITSTVGITDDVDLARSAHVELTAPIGIHDVASDVDARVFHSLILDQVGITDPITVLFERQFHYTAGDNVDLTDTVDFLYAFNRHVALSEPIDVTDTVVVDLDVFQPSLPRMTEFGPCSVWEPRWPCDVSCESPIVTAQAAASATETLWAFSGRQFGLCEVTLRPCRRECSDFPWPGGGWTEWAGSSWISPALISGQWFNVVCGRCRTSCSCTEVSEVLLPAPVHDIVEVKIDGVVIPPSEYRLDDNRTLVALGFDWPTCNDFNKSDSEPDTWSVTARYGLDVPEGGKWAVGELACELIKAFNNEDCRLPRNVTQLVRQGVTIQFPAVSELFARGQTGLYLVDQFIATWNPSGLRRRSGVYSVDTPPHRRAGT